MNPVVAALDATRSRAVDGAGASVVGSVVGEAVEGTFGAAGVVVGAAAVAVVLVAGTVEFVGVGARRATERGAPARPDAARRGPNTPVAVAASATTIASRRSGRHRMPPDIGRSARRL